MQYSAIVLGFASVAAAVSSYTGTTISPTAPAPAGCTGTYSGSFELGITKISAASKLKRQSESNVTDALVITLNNGVLQDNEGRIGYIASNEQFQFNTNGQAGEKYTAGFSVCANNTLALGGSAVWYECLSGSFYNIYDANWAAQCMPVLLDVIAYTATSSATSASATATTATDGQIGGSSAATTPASTSATASASVSTSVSAVTSSAAVVSSISDHQIQGATSTSAIVSSTTLSSTITPTSSAVTTSSAAIISSISDHQIQGPTSTSAIVTAYTGAAAMPTAAAGLLLAAAGAAAALL